MSNKDNKEVISLSVRELLSRSDDHYGIPVYQRNYAWGESQIRQLVKDVLDSAKAEVEKYYIGTVVVNQTIEGNRKHFETIDGQQRLTTLHILSMVLKNDKTLKDDVNMDWFDHLKLGFSNRRKSTQTLNDLFSDMISPSGDNNHEILEAYKLAKAIIKTEVQEYDTSYAMFANYLFDKVTILRVAVPHDTDLNHYFEIMNNRGEQLEKHEVLKASFLDAFNHIDNEEEAERQSFLFHKIWEAASNMEKYVQYGFHIDHRKLIFDRDWKCLKGTSFNHLLELLGEGFGKGTSSIDAIELDDILKPTRISAPKEDGINENPDRFESLVNFPNFLLHVLRVHTELDIPLDDKRLLSSFKDYMKGQSAEDKLEFVKDFGFALLKARYLFDKYVIKRDYSGGGSEWSLLRMQQYDGNKGNYKNVFEINSQQQQVVQLLAMFHVSIPTLSYKHWISAALNFVYHRIEETITSRNYIEYLEKVAYKFVFGRIVAKSPKEYYNIIYKNEVINATWSEGSIDFNKFTFDGISNNLLFNYIDYLFWKKEKQIESGRFEIVNFKFTQRSSVEHFYPQNPKEGFPPLKDKKALHCIGNLCLISHSENSSLSNHSPLAKTEFYLKNGPGSIKQIIMMRDYDVENWNAELIYQHEYQIEELLKEELQQYYIQA